MTHHGDGVLLGEVVTSVYAVAPLRVVVETAVVLSERQVVNAGGLLSHVVVVGGHVWRQHWL